VDFARFGRDRGVDVRFIEFMPLDADERWNRSLVVPRDEIVATIDAILPLETVRRDHQPAERYRFRDGRGVIGVIPSVTDAFCDSCDRVRLTPEGGLRSCLFAHDETDLRAVMRSGGTDDDLATAISDTVGAKWAGHAIGQVHFIRPSKSMSQIGG
jgi:cyclic pyranopterin phosphate synthase